MTSAQIDAFVLEKKGGEINGELKMPKVIEKKRS